MNKRYVHVPASLSRASTLADGTVRVVFDTQELRGETLAALFDLKNQVGHLIFSPSNNDVKIPDSPIRVDKKEQTPSQQLRAVIFVQWQESDKTIDFEEYYRLRMRQIIERERYAITKSIDNHL